MPRKRLDLTGQRFGRLVVIELHHIANKIVFWKCKCDCGNETIVRRNHLRSGTTKSCGCYHKERTSETSKLHGMSHTKFRRLFNSMKRRCYEKNNQSYKNYGGRGIKVLRESFEEFRDDIYESYIEHKKNNKYTTIERIDVNWHYCKDNCKRATKKEQSNNKRNNVKVVINGETKNLLEWLELYGTHASTYQYRRSKLGRDILESITTPPMHSSLNLTYNH